MSQVLQTLGVGCGRREPARRHGQCHRLSRHASRLERYSTGYHKSEDLLVYPVGYEWRLDQIRSHDSVVVTGGSANDGYIGECKRSFPFDQLRMTQRN